MDPVHKNKTISDLITVCMKYIPILLPTDVLDYICENLHDIILLFNYFSITIGINTLRKIAQKFSPSQDEEEKHMTYEEC